MPDLAGLIRETDFLVGSGTNVFDGTDSPLKIQEAGQIICDSQKLIMFFFMIMMVIIQNS